jgi:hypothetical protein
MMVISGSKLQNTELQYDDGFCWDLSGQKPPEIKTVRDLENPKVLECHYTTETGRF